MAFYLWLILGVVLLVTEAALLNFYTAWFGIGAFAAAFSAYIGGDFSYQVAAFLITSVVSLAAFRKPFLRMTRKDAVTPSNVDAMVGKTALVLEAIRDGAKGRVKVDGEVWLALSMDGDHEAGERVVIDRVEGAVLFVRTRVSA